ncbi:MAG TPA: Bro-N domain-containing protein [archaeon]|nr:Bro-N domain-containing protein [archaeon]
MSDINQIEVFEDKNIRRMWHQEDWWYSVVDVVRALTESSEPKRYWSDLKIKLKEEGSEVVTTNNQLYGKIVQLKLQSSDGKFYETDCANLEGIFRIIQSIPSKKAEPFKLWLARVGNQRIKEIIDPELAINRARNIWLQKGYDEQWIQQRMLGQEIRNKLTNYWKNHEIKTPEEYAILTNIIHQEWSDLTVKEHKKLKGIDKDNLRDHMTDAEIIFTALAELSTRKVAESTKSTGFTENKESGIIGGGIAKNARKELESKTYQKVVTKDNYFSEKKKLEEKQKKLLSPKKKIIKYSA